MPENPLVAQWHQEFAVKWLTTARDKHVKGYTDGTALEAATKAAGLQKEAFEAADPGYTLQI